MVASSQACIITLMFIIVMITFLELSKKWRYYGDMVVDVGGRFVIPHFLFLFLCNIMFHTVHVNQV